MQKIAISLAGHTNNGKTTLARTLLRRDVGEVADRPHVTDLADGHLFVKNGDSEIILWDLPGFGDSVRLNKRLEKTGLIAWLQTTFDRFQDRPLWCSQQCIKNAQNDADVVLYLIEASADPTVSAEITAELEVLQKIEKPIVILLNQTGLPDSKRDTKLAKEWLEALKCFPHVQAVMPLDGWMRCWIQEAQLLDRISPLLAEEKQSTYAELIAKWKQEHHDDVFEESVTILAEGLIETAQDNEVIHGETIGEKIKSKFSSATSEGAKEAQERLKSGQIKRSSEIIQRLLKAHKVEGMPQDRADDLIKELKTSTSKDARGLGAVLGGIGSGLASGLMADILAGGMTLGGGAIVGSLLGGLGGYAAGLGYNRFKGDDGSTCIGWEDDFLENEWISSGIRYLTISHHGRGQGGWQEPIESNLPEKWESLIVKWSQKHRDEIDDALKGSKTKKTKSLLRSMLSDVLSQLYPNA